MSDGNLVPNLTPKTQFWSSWFFSGRISAAEMIDDELAACLHLVRT